MLKSKLKKINFFILIVSGLNIFLNYKTFATNENIKDRLTPAYKDFFGIEDEKEKQELKKESETKNETKKNEKEIKNKEFENINIPKQLKNNVKVLERKKQTEKENNSLKIFEDEKKILKEKNKTNSSLKNTTEKVLKNDEKKELKINEITKKIENEVNTTKKEKKTKEEEVKTDKKFDLKLKNDALKKNNNSTEDKDICLDAVNYLNLILQKNIKEFNNIFRNIIKIPDKRILNLIVYDEDFKKREFYGTILNLLKKELNVSDLKKTINENKNLNEEIFKKLAELYEKNKKKIFLNPSEVGFYFGDLIENFNLELKNNSHNAARFDKNFFLRGSYLDNYKVSDYKIKRLVNKFTNRYFVYVDDETKINVVLAVPGWDFKHVIFLKNPNKKTLKIAEELKNVKKIIDKDGIKFINNDINEDFIAKIYSCLKEQYYDERDNILFLIKDSLKSYYKNAFDFDTQIDNYKYSTILKLLKENLFTKLYNDDYNDYPTKYVDDKKEEDFEENKEKLNSFEYLTQENKDFFDKDGENYKYCGEVEYKLPKYFKAKSKDILDFDRDGLKDLLKKELEKFGYFNFDVDFDILNDSFKMKFFGNDEQDFKKEKFLNNLGEINGELISKLDYDFVNNKDLTGFLLKCNNLNKNLKMYEEIRTDKKKFEKFFRDNWELNNLRLFYTYSFGRSFSDDFDKNFAVAPIDWSTKYRVKTPIWDLILKSFKEKGELFSDTVFDIEEDTINDYVLRIYENLKNGSVDLANLFFEGEQNVTIHENLNYKESDY